MEPIPAGTKAPAIPEADLMDGRRAVVFYKVTCPTCQIAAPAMERLHETFPGRVTVVVQDPRERADAFAREFGTSFSSIPDTEPYEVSNDYGIRTVPTLFLLEDGVVRDVVESWDREGWNRIGSGLAGGEGGTLSIESDGLPPFRPG